jgi:hypothetical protein
MGVDAAASAPFSFSTSVFNPQVLASTWEQKIRL